MNIDKKIEKIKNKITGTISINESLSKLSWFNLGGPARAVFRPKNLNELSIFLREINGTEKIKVLGAGSNTLIRDGGFNGIIIKLGKPFSHLSLFKEEMLIAGSAAFDKSLSLFALENSIAGFEFLSCIPGTIGGAIKMNSGCYEEDISKILISVQVMDLSGKIQVINSDNIKFSYRETNLDKNLIFVSATFKGNKDTKINIKKKWTI
jgi:UDP-N-acetylmuramate dehydrogenase